MTKDYSIQEIIKIFLAVTDTLPVDFKALAYFSCKLSSAQMNYTVLEKELLSIVESLINYCSMFLGNHIVVFTDHLNLLYNTLSQHSLHCRILIEEYGATFVHHSGAINITTDTLSRLPVIDADKPLLVRREEARFNDAYLFYPAQIRKLQGWPVSFAIIKDCQRSNVQL